MLSTCCVPAVAITEYDKVRRARPCLAAVFCLAHSANQCMCWPQFSWVRKKDSTPWSLWPLPAVTFSSSRISSSGNLHCSCTTRNACTCDYQRTQHIRKLTPTHKHIYPLWHFLRSGKQVQRLAVEPKSVRRACAWIISQLVYEILKSVAGKCPSTIKIMLFFICSSLLPGIYHKP